MKHAFIFAVCIFPTIALAGLSESQRKSQLEKALGIIVATATPQKPAVQREKMIQEYVDAKANKGFAIEPINSSYWRSTTHEDQAVTGDRVLEGCQLKYGKPCALLAVNDDLASEGEITTKDMPRLKYSSKFATDKIPIIRLSARRRPEVQNYDRAMEPKAMVIHPWGAVFISAGDASVKDAQDAALNKCNHDQERKGQDGGCFVYAVNNDVVISERRMTAK